MKHVLVEDKKVNEQYSWQIPPLYYNNVFTFVARLKAVQGAVDDLLLYGIVKTRRYNPLVLVSA